MKLPRTRVTIVCEATQNALVHIQVEPLSGLVRSGSLCCDKLALSMEQAVFGVSTIPRVLSSSTAHIFRSSNFTGVKHDKRPALQAVEFWPTVWEGAAQVIATTGTTFPIWSTYVLFSYENMRGFDMTFQNVTSKLVLRNSSPW